jgi:hypothetical protein
MVRYIGDYDADYEPFTILFLVVPLRQRRAQQWLSSTRV